MAIGVVFDFPGGTAEQYDQVCRGINNGQVLTSLSQWPGGGCLAHAAGATEGGWRVIDVWESEEKFRQFGERLMPLLQQAGLNANLPQVFPLHNTVLQ